MSQTNVASAGSETERTRENEFFQKAARRIPVAQGKIIYGAPTKSLFSNNKTKNKVDSTQKRREYPTDLMIDWI